MRKVLSLMLFAVLLAIAPQAQAEQVKRVKVDKPIRMLPASAYLIATYDETGRPDACIIDRAGIAETPSGKMIFYIGILPTRVTAQNIDKAGAFTVNILDANVVPQADYCGNVSNQDAELDKFKVTGLKLAKGDDVNAPIVTDCPVNFECKVIKALMLPDAQHKIFFGEIISYHVKSNLLIGDKTKPVMQFDHVKDAATAYVPGSSEGSGYYEFNGPLGKRGKVWREKFNDVKLISAAAANHKPADNKNKEQEIKEQAQDSDALLKFTGAPHFLPAPVMTVGAYTAEGEANFAVFHRGGFLTSGKGGNDRLAIGIKDIKHSLTYKLIKETGACTVNIPSTKYLAEIDLLGSFSGLTPDGKEFQDKLKAAGLTAAKAETVNAPYINEMPITLECELEDEFSESDASKGRLLILKIKSVSANEDYLDARGKINPIGKDGSSILFFSHSHAANGGYYGLGKFLGKSGNVSEKFMAK